MFWFVLLRRTDAADHLTVGVAWDLRVTAVAEDTHGDGKLTVVRRRSQQFQHPGRRRRTPRHASEDGPERRAEDLIRRQSGLLSLPQVEERARSVIARESRPIATVRQPQTKTPDFRAHLLLRIEIHELAEDAVVRVLKPHADNPIDAGVRDPMIVERGTRDLAIDQPEEARAVRVPAALSWRAQLLKDGSKAALSK